MSLRGRVEKQLKVIGAENMMGSSIQLFILFVWRVKKSVKVYKSMRNLVIEFSWIRFKPFCDDF
jgi:hypothetical protein